jgi:hypothetical protein
MKLKYLTALSIIALAVIISCNKDNFETKPTIKVKGFNSKEIRQGESLIVTLEMTDKEGDGGKGELTYIRIRTNKRLPLNDLADTVFYPIPAFPPTSKTDVNVTIPYDFMNEDPNENDSMFFRFTVRDLKDNISDTVNSEPVVARQN